MSASIARPSFMVRLASPTPSRSHTTCSESVSPAISESVQYNTPLWVYVPPLNFAILSEGIYRAGFPRPENFPYLDSLGLRTILYLADQDIKEDTLEWANKRGLRVLHFRVDSNKEPLSECSQTIMASALHEAIKPANHPILIHCNRGRHRAGLLCALIRRLQNWSMTMIFDEYKRFFGLGGNSEGKNDKIGDYEWIETFDLTDFETHNTQV